MKDKKTALLLSIFLGQFGADRFYLGYTKMGVIKLLTGGCLGILWIVDIIRIASGRLQPADENGYIASNQIKYKSLSRSVSENMMALSIIAVISLIVITLTEIWPDMSELAVILIFALSSIVISIYWFGIYGPLKVKQAKEALKVCRFEGDTLYVDEQSPALSKVLHFSELKVKQYKYNPEKIHFGAVTVGGVTTGGTYKTGGDYSNSDHAVGRYELVYTAYMGAWSVVEGKVKRIVISDSLKEKAKQSSILQCLKGNEITVVYSINAASNQQVHDLIRLGYKTEAVNLMKMIEATGYPDKERGNAISELLCGK